ncbi:MAG: hypothetical protein PHX38_10310 [Sulfuricella sp.]|nr:hypothetical protein [Sulfuricella sp.]
MSKYIRLAARPICNPCLLQRAFWLTVWLSISPMAMSSQVPGSTGNDMTAEARTQPAPENSLGRGAPERRLSANLYRSAPPAMKIPVIILWDESGKTSGPGSAPARVRASITTCQRG